MGTCPVYSDANYPVRLALGSPGSLHSHSVAVSSLNRRDHGTYPVEPFHILRLHTVKPILRFQVWTLSISRNVRLGLASERPLFPAGYHSTSSKLAANILFSL